ncbi:hypothetical protein L3Q82_020133 [Scortum barcoo]|uniref:Uncharacterized protein n=1 Tax=Scortum barcoo TaxID=214431 RepID=A0ACB8VDQ4_9TELE|nr:hypothetical protein L3Q82_020133 [Scortum barcoo]
MKTLRLTELIRHAKHAERQIAAEKTKKSNGREKQAHVILLILVQTFAENMAGNKQRPARNWRGPGFNRRGRNHGRRGRGRQSQGHSWVGKDECYLCRKKGHWAADCPEREDDSGAWDARHPSETWLNMAHAIMPEYAQFVSPEQLHCTAYVSQGPDPECDNEFSAEVKDSLHCSVCFGLKAGVLSQ